MTILDLFDAALRDRAASPAIDDVTYEALHRGARRVATMLAARGLVRGERIALYSENRIGFVYAYLAALRLGAIAVPTNVLYRKSDLEHVLTDAAVLLAAVSPASRPHAEAVTGAQPLVDLELVERWAADDDIAPYEGPAPEYDDVAAIIYTSGTTGRAKGAMITHGNFATISMQLTTGWRWTYTDSLYLSLPLFHLHGLGSALNGTLTAGARALLRERFDARDALDTMRSGQVTMFFGVPTMYVRLLEAVGDEPAPHLRLFVSGSAALSADIHRAFEARFGSAILERYGATEFGFALSNRYAGPRVPGAVGVPFPGTFVRIVDAEDVDVDPGDVGELLIWGPNVFAGYWRRPDATAAAFLSGSDGRPWYKSGDLAAYDTETRTYRIVGRLKELIISAGFNVYPSEVEAEMDRFPGVRASALVGAPDQARGELPVAFLECEAPIDPEAFLAHLREQLASFKVPKAVYVVEALPRNAMGKIERTRLREQVAQPR